MYPILRLCLLFAASASWCDTTTRMSNTATLFSDEQNGFVQQDGSALFSSVRTTKPENRTSLFVARSTQGRFGLNQPSASFQLSPSNLSVAHKLRDIVANAEAGHAGYDAVQYGARILPPNKPTEMTIGQIFVWIDATPGQPHAIGRYQFIPKTLSRLVSAADLSLKTRFSKKVQDDLADILLSEAGLLEALNGGLDRIKFMRNLAKIWAGLPLPNGKSFYEGYAGNRASVDWAHFDAAIKRAFEGS
jgi:hypothetical protein